MGEKRPVLQKSEEGKTVVGAAGEEIGMVTRVTADAIYVHPEPSLVDRVKATLDWRGYDEDAFRIDADLIERIDGTEIEIRAGDRDD